MSDFKDKPTQGSYDHNDEQQMSNTDAFLDDYFSDLLSVEPEPIKKKLNASTRLEAKKLPTKSVSAKKELSEKERSKKKFDSNTPAKIKASNKHKVVQDNVTNDQALKAQSDKHDHDVAPSIADKQFIIEPLRAPVLSKPMRKAECLKGLHADLNSIEHESTQKKALQQLLNRSLENTSESIGLKSPAQEKALVNDSNTKKPKEEAVKQSEVKPEKPTPMLKPEVTERHQQVASHKTDVFTDLHHNTLPNPHDKTSSLQPEWGQTDFEVLLFSVAGLTLAVPLVSLGQIYPLNDDITPIFGKSKWYMGIKTTPTGTVHVVNTAMFVMPEKYQQSHAQSVKYVVTIDGYPWGLAVDKIDQPQTITQAQVKWRTERTKRVWLAGTIKSAMCGLIDVQKMGEILVNDEKS